MFLLLSEAENKLKHSLLNLKLSTRLPRERLISRWDFEDTVTEASGQTRVVDLVQDETTVSF